eukprot:2066864-Amphidinium_carterae.1
MSQSFFSTFGTSVGKCLSGPWDWGGVGVDPRFGTCVWGVEWQQSTCSRAHQQGSVRVLCETHRSSSHKERKQRQRRGLFFTHPELSFLTFRPMFLEISCILTIPT